jgi:hypothetical protein
MACAGVLRFGPGLKVEIPPRAEVEAEIASEIREGINDGLAGTIAGVKLMHAKIGPPIEKGRRQ